MSLNEDQMGRYLKILENFQQRFSQTEDDMPIQLYTSNILQMKIDNNEHLEMELVSLIKSIFSHNIDDEPFSTYIQEFDNFYKTRNNHSITHSTPKEKGNTNRDDESQHLSKKTKVDDTLTSETLFQFMETPNDPNNYIDFQESEIVFDGIVDDIMQIEFKM